MSIIDLLKEESSKSDDKMYGLTLGIVTNTEDPENLGRVKVQLLLRDTSDNETDWIRVAVPFAGNKMGAYFIPDVMMKSLWALSMAISINPLLWLDYGIQKTNPQLTMRKERISLK